MFRTIRSKLIFFTIILLVFVNISWLLLEQYSQSKVEKYYQAQNQSVSNKVIEKLVGEYEINVLKFLERYLNDESIYTLADAKDGAKLKTLTDGILRGLTDASLNIEVWSFAALDGSLYVNSFMNAHSAEKQQAYNKIIAQLPNCKLYLNALANKKESTFIALYDNTAFLWVVVPTKDADDKINGYSLVATDLSKPINSAKQVLNSEITLVNNAGKPVFSTEEHFISLTKDELISTHLNHDNIMYEQVVFPIRYKSSENIGTFLISSNSSEKHKFESIIDIIVFLFVLISGILFTLMGVFFIDKTTKPIISSIGNLKNITEQVANASIQLSDSAKQLSENSIKQATSIDQTSSSLEEMSNTISTNIEQVENVSQRSTEVSSISSDATNSMNQLEEAMKDILDSNDKIEQLVGIIKNIADKIKVLDEIVFQTKLLSFNASVEAERAGEYGRGFAVVAQEVGNLAVLSGKSAVEIDQIVKNSVKQTEEITKENKIKAQKGKDLALSTAKILNNISMQIANVNESSISVLGSSKQQKIGINQINQAMLEIDKASQENTTTAENTAKYANSLEDQVKALHGVVDTVSHVVIN